jgi:hypothetical protein
VSSVDPVVRLLADLDHPASPRVEFQNELLARLLAELEETMGRTPEAQASARSNGWRARVLRAVRRRPGRTMLAFAAVAVAAAAALFVSSPWKTAPGFLEEVQAALTPPPGRILHVKWDHIFTSKDPACTSTGRHEFWIDTTPPHRYRAILPLPPDPANADPRRLPCVRGTPAEVGGDLGKPNLRFVLPNRLVFDRPLYFPVEQDPWAFAREMISEGRAHREGTTQLDGRTVERVRFDPPDSCPAPAAGHCPTEPEYGYFDPETLYPVAWDYARDPMFPLWRNRERYLAYEYLPRTEANLALTDIRAQHPEASGP